MASGYDDPCGIARAIELVGDRWALLVVRELAFGGKRFAQLRAGLHGISPNVLSQRLRDLEAAGVVARRVIARPADVTLYELTARGAELEPVLVALGRWGSREAITSSQELSVSALLLALKTTFAPRRPRDAAYALTIDGERFLLTCAGGEFGVRRDGSSPADAELVGDAATVRKVVFGRETIGDAERAGRLTVSGDRRAAARLPRMFRVPTAA
jgi:DNA-binding HxlR family transcriptional regulator